MHCKAVSAGMLRLAGLNLKVHIPKPIISVQPTQCTHRRCDILHMRFLSSLSSFFIGVLDHCCMAFLIFKIVKRKKNNIAAKVNEKFADLHRKGRGDATALRRRNHSSLTHLYFRPFHVMDHITISAPATESKWAQAQTT